LAEHRRNNEVVVVLGAEKRRSMYLTVNGIEIWAELHAPGTEGFFGYDGEQRHLL
jgi:hypothetical protein